jgi:hypothetical protein
LWYLWATKLLGYKGMCPEDHPIRFSPNIYATLCENIFLKLNAMNTYLA